jgi:hypothetical protein
MNSVFNFALPTAEKSVGGATGYWNSLLSGNRPAEEVAVQPETNAIRSGADAAKRNLAAFGTSRGGGVNAVNQQVGDTTRGKIENLIAGARPAAARASAATGEGLLGEAGKTAGEITELASTSRTTSNQLTRQVVGDFGAALEAGLNIASGKPILSTLANTAGSIG